MSLAAMRTAFAAAVLATISPLASGCGARAPLSSPPETAAPALSVAGLLSQRGRATDGDEFARALMPRAFRFPDDDGPHSDFRSEWWYFTGVLRARDGAGAARARRFGYEMTIFREALAPTRPARPSAWATRDVFMAHLAITDVDGPSGATKFRAYERFARDGLGLGGATARPFAVWVDDWRMQGPADASLPIRLIAHDDDGSAIALTVGDGGAGRDPIPQGDHGLSAKGPAPGNASFYYSRPRLTTRGSLTLAADATGPGGTFQVEGLSWMDREWGTTALGAGVRGWDWLGVHLSDGRDLMLYRLRGDDGRPTAESRLTLIAADGHSQVLGPESFTLTPLEEWVSPHSGARYPVSVRLEVPAQSLRLVARALVADQELRLTIGYWEGAVSIAGTAAGAPLGGEGYLELTGYGGGQRHD